MNDSASKTKNTDSCLLSIIVPVYNVEKYIRACLESIYRQNLDERIFEVIIVNDGTKDRSMEVIADIIDQHANISVIHQENLSLSVARNNGIAAAKGEYILMPDSDDLLIDNSLSVLLENAISSKADLIVADFVEMTNKEIDRLTTIQQKALTVVEKTGEQLFLEDLNPRQCYVWRTLFRREFLTGNKLSFVPGIRYQDVPFTHECYLKARKCLRVSWLLNIYRRGNVSATCTFDVGKGKDLCTAMRETWKLRQCYQDMPIVRQKIENDTYASFKTLISWIGHSLDKQSERMEILSYLKQQIPDLTFKNTMGQTVTYWCYQTMPLLYMNFNYYGRKIKHYLK